MSICARSGDCLSWVESEHWFSLTERGRHSHFRLQLLAGFHKKTAMEHVDEILVYTLFLLA